MCIKRKYKLKYLSIEIKKSHGCAGQNLVKSIKYIVSIFSGIGKSLLRWIVWTIHSIIWLLH